MAKGKTKSIDYLVGCDHPGCRWSIKVTLEKEVVHWRAPVTAFEFTEETDGAYVPQRVTKAWDGQPLEDAYEAHHQQVHVPQRQPPMIIWSKA